MGPGCREREVVGMAGGREGPFLGWLPGAVETYYVPSPT